MFGFLKSLFSTPKNTVKPEMPQVRVSGLTVTVSAGSTLSSSRERFDSGSVARVDDGWVLNPKSTFPITVTGLTGSQATDLKALLDDPSVYYGTSRDRLVEFVARSNVHWKEFDSYVSGLKPRYAQAIERRQRESSEWSAAAGLDRDDLLDGFKKQAIEELDLGAMFEGSVILEDEPADLTIDDALIDRYGFGPVQTYVARADKLDKVHRVGADSYGRDSFEQLAASGLAARGQEIPLGLILASLTLKELNALAADAPKPFSRKAKAVEFLEAQPDLNSRLSVVVAFRELFQLKPLPAEFAGLNLTEVASGWKHAGALARLLAHTYSTGNSAAERLSHDYDFAKGWQILATDDSCAECKRAAARNYSKKNPPKVPVHIGCRCAVMPFIE